METPTPTNSKVDIIGVSRSGRVRKKSSKLMDFQSPDEVPEPSQTIFTPSSQPKAIISGGPPAVKKRPGRPPKHPPLQQQPQQSPETPAGNLITNLSTTPQSVTPGSAIGLGSIGSDDDDEILDDVLNELDELHEMEENDGEDDEDGADPTVRKSLYMSEKWNKKKIFKDGKVVYEKTQRKDKGKTRFTAYMLWARDAKKSLEAKHSDTDVRRLREMWSNVSNTEKQKWRHKAKRVGVKIKKGSESPASPSKSTFLNRATTSRTKKLFEKEQMKSPATPQKRRHPKSPKSSSVSPSPTKQQKVYVINSPTDDSQSSIFQTIPLKNHHSGQIHSGVYKVTGMEPLDVAAHLKLLGDNLSIIGERLKEHEGQITVSGSLSVLLDSLLCSLGPLMCLTTKIPSLGTEYDKELRANLTKTLDNIAYVMPGL